MDTGWNGRAGGRVSPERHQLTRHTVRGALVGTVLLGGVAVIQALRAGAELARVAQPILVFALIGLTVGGLVGPLLGRAIQGHRRK